jgi:GNAT superfamily N-acetyltransferase
MPEPVIRVRPAAANDVPLILGLIRELAEYEKLAHAVVAGGAEEALRRHLFGEGGDRPAAECLIGELDGAPQGFALFFSSFSTFLARPGIYLEDLYVRPAARGRGLGRALLARLAALAVERSAARLEWSVLDWNEPAIGFYTNVGAEPMSEWTVYRLSGRALHALAATSRADESQDRAGPTPITG